MTGFDQRTIDDACSVIEREDKRGFPSLGRLLNECRANAVKHHSEHKSTHWTIERYRQCKAFDDWLRSEIEHHHRDPKELCAAHLQETIMWSAWKTQKLAGTLDCPGWCDACEGSRYTIVTGEDGEQYAKRCEKCKR